MQTKIYSTSPSDIETCGQILRRGGLVAFPTETVYGLGANAFDAAAVRAIFTAKGRPSDNPLIVHVADAAALSAVVADISETAQKLMDALMPGALTLVLEKSPEIPGEVTAGLSTVAVRIPSNDTALRLIRAAGVPVCAPSANLSTRPSPTAFRHVYADLNGRVEAIIDGGDCEIGVESTVLDLTGAPVILREGGVTRAQIEAVIGKIADYRETAGEPPKSPGMKYRHYAPAAELYLSNGDASAVCAFYDKQTAAGERCVILCGDESCYAPRAVFSTGNTADAYARRLFSLLRRADEEGYTCIVAELPPGGGRYAAVMNRLKKASGGKTV